MTVLNSERVPRDIVVVGASAGGVAALRNLIAALPAQFPGTIAVVVHRSPFFESDLPQVLAGQTDQHVVEPKDGDTMVHGRIYVAPRDRHMVITGRRLRLNRGPKEHHTRPAVDPLFQSAADAAGSRVVGVVLTGGGDDGVDGLIAIKAAGGISVAQAPDDAPHPYMPMNAIRYDDVDVVLPLAQLVPVLVELAAGRSVPTRETFKRAATSSTRQR